VQALAQVGRELGQLEAPMTRCASSAQCVGNRSSSGGAPCRRVGQIRDRLCCAYGHGEKLQRYGRQADRPMRTRDRSHRRRSSSRYRAILRRAPARPPGGWCGVQNPCRHSTSHNPGRPRVLRRCRTDERLDRLRARLDERAEPRAATRRAPGRWLRARVHRGGQRSGPSWPARWTTCARGTRWWCGSSTGSDDRCGT
jgi:hypothetical protein